MTKITHKSINAARTYYALRRKGMPSAEAHAAAAKPMPSPYDGMQNAAAETGWFGMQNQAGFQASLNLWRLA